MFFKARLKWNFMKLASTYALFLSISALLKQPYLEVFLPFKIVLDHLFVFLFISSPLTSHILSFCLVLQPPRLLNLPLNKYASWSLSWKSHSLQILYTLWQMPHPSLSSEIVHPLVFLACNREYFQWEILENHLNCLKEREVPAILNRIISLGMGAIKTGIMKYCIIYGHWLSLTWIKVNKECCLSKIATNYLFHIFPHVSMFIIHVQLKTF